MPFRPDHSGPAFPQELMKFRRLERPARTVDETADTILLGFRRVIAETIQFLEPEQMLLRLLKIEAAGIENAFEGSFGEISLNDIGDWVERADDLARRVQLPGGRVVDL